MTQCCLAAVAEDVRYCVQASQQDSLLRGAAANIDHGVEQIGPALAALRVEKQSLMRLRECM